MDFQAPPPQASFIPKRNLTPSVGRPRVASSLLTFIAAAVFLASLAAYGGAFLYKQNLTQQIITLNASLSKARDSYQEDTLSGLSRFDLKTGVAQSLLDQHVSILPIYDLLEGLTLQTVRFKSFKFGMGDNSKIAISMSGEAKGYSSIALQADQFAAAKGLSDVLFNDLNLDQSGNVVFNFSATLDPKFISYRDARAGGI